MQKRSRMNRKLEMWVEGVKTKRFGDRPACLCYRVRVCSFWCHFNNCFIIIIQHCQYPHCYRHLNIVRHKLWHLEWISNETILYSTGKYTPSLGIEHYMEDSMRKGKSLGQYALQQKLTQQCVNNFNKIFEKRVLKLFVYLSPFHLFNFLMTWILLSTLFYCKLRRAFELFLK